MRVAIHSKPEVFDHSTLWTHEWVAYCRELNVEFEVLDFFSNEAHERLKNADIALWYLTNYSLQEMSFARSVLRSYAHSGTRVFPNEKTSWHFDDKVSQMFLLRSAGLPIPKSWFFATEDEALDGFRRATYPLVAKLKGGSGASNVRLIRSPQEAKSYTHRMFGRGFSPAPSLPFKAVSNLRSAKSIPVLWARAKRAPEFLRTRRQGQLLPRERGYVYLQEFVPNDGYDVKIVVVGDKLTAFGRKVRPSDFRASGGGDILDARDLITRSIINSAFQAADTLDTQCIGFDYVVDQTSGEGAIIEMSYAFNFELAADVHGHWTRDGEWHPETLNAPREVLKNLLQS